MNHSGESVYKYLWIVHDKDSGGGERRGERGVGKSACAINPQIYVTISSPRFSHTFFIAFLLWWLPLPSGAFHRRQLSLSLSLFRPGRAKQSKARTESERARRATPRAAAAEAATRLTHLRIVHSTLQNGFVNRHLSRLCYAPRFAPARCQMAS